MYGTENVACHLISIIYDIFWLSNFQIRIFLYIFNVFLDALPMIVFSSSSSILIEIYIKLCEANLPSALMMLLDLLSAPS
jgi:hypothetical protein